MLSLYRPFTSLLRDDPFQDRDFNPWGSSPLSNAIRSAHSFNPAVDIVEKEDAYLVKAEVPGLAPENVDVQVENDVLTVRGERRYENEEEQSGYRRVERSYGSFARSFVLPKGVNPDSIQAQLENGILTVTIPKVTPASARKVEVKGGGLVDKAKQLFTKATENKPPQA